MSTSSSDGPVRTAWLALMAILWLQLYAACSYGWKYGEYYSYGWYVPPLVAYFFWRIRDVWQGKPVSSPGLPLMLVGGFGVFAFLFVLRVVERVDPRWTLPIWIQASLVVSTTLFVFRRLAGWQGVRRVLPIILFACSAIPQPTQIERAIVSALTESVVSSSVVLLGAIGMQVHAVGDQLGMMGEVVRVTEGCSGIKSAQSFLMSSLFFGELLRLGTGARVMLVFIGLLSAWAINVVRATSLAVIRFKKGGDAFEGAHDTAGLVAFLVGSVLLLAVAGWLEARRQNRRTVRKQTGRGLA